MYQDGWNMLAWDFKNGKMYGWKGFVTKTSETISQMDASACDKVFFGGDVAGSTTSDVFYGIIHTIIIESNDLSQAQFEGKMLNNSKFYLIF